MSRTIDRLLSYLDEMDGLSPTEREVIRRRIDQPPTTKELEEARSALYPAALTNATKATR